MAVQRRRAAIKLASLASLLLIAALNIFSDDVSDSLLRRRTRAADEPADDWRQRSTKAVRDAYRSVPAAGGYFNLSCPFEWSKYSCAHMARGPKAAEIVRASTDYYLEHLEDIQAAFDKVAATNDGRGPKRVFFAGDSLMRQLFVGVACGAWSRLGGSLIEEVATPWKDEWPCHRHGTCFVRGGPHSGFDAASVRLRGGLELHYVPHRGFKDEETAEVDVLDRLEGEVAELGKVTFGDRTAMPPGGEDVDVLVYNVGIHYGSGVARKYVRQFANNIVRPLAEQEGNATLASNIGNGVSPTPRRPRTIYVTTPSQHYGTDDGTWQKGMTAKSKQCVDIVPSNPRADMEREILMPGINVDVLLDYGDLDLGRMHVSKGDDCSHYCMPGVPDVVAARLLEEILI